MIKTKNKIGSTVNRRIVGEEEEEEEKGKGRGVEGGRTGQEKDGMTGPGRCSRADTSSKHKHKHNQAGASRVQAVR